MSDEHKPKPPSGPIVRNIISIGNGGAGVFIDKSFTAPIDFENVVTIGNKKGGFVVGGDEEPKTSKED